MSPKKIFITIGLVVIVAVLVIVIYVLSQKKRVGVGSQIQLGNQAAATLPSGTESPNSQANVEKAQKIFENINQETISEGIKKDGSKKIDFKNQEGSPIPLSDFEKALGVEIPSKIQEYLSNGYQIFYCPGPDGKKEYGAYLDYNQVKIYRGFTYDVLDMMKSWETTIFPNFHTVLFPNIDFSQDDLNQKIEFRDGKYRYAEVNLPGGKKGSINYEDVEFGVIIAASPSCLEKVHQYYAPSEP